MTSQLKNTDVKRPNLFNNKPTIKRPHLQKISIWIPSMIKFMNGS